MTTTRRSTTVAEAPGPLLAHWADDGFWPPLALRAKRGACMSKRAAAREADSRGGFPLPLRVVSPGIKAQAPSGALPADGGVAPPLVPLIASEGSRVLRRGLPPGIEGKCQSSHRTQLSIELS
ncbi:hypothetical protein Cma02nite_21390 [Cellulomonas marina]|nr:hypothetical protein Cma02nite_21390 [Cellulomonas marina]